MGDLTRTIKVAATLTLFLVGAVSVRAADSAGDYSEARKAFQEAYARAVANVPGAANVSESANGPEATTADPATLRSYPLYPYLEAARIRRALMTGTPESVRAADKQAAQFLAAHGQEPVARALRRAWLDGLAQRSEWPQFLEVYGDSTTSDATTRCESFVARIQVGKTEGLAADIAKQWLTPHSLPECERPFAWLKDNGLLTTELIAKRARLALENGDPTFARQMIQQLPPEAAAPLAQWASLIENPERSVDALIAAPDTPVDSAALQAGWSRLARTDPDRAKQRYEPLIRARGFSGETASPLALTLAMSLAWDRDPDALDYFDRVAARDLTDGPLEWRARAALWRKDWKNVAQSIAAMSETSRQTARWRYWAARAAAQLKDPERARQLYQSLDADDNYYSAMAAAHLHRPVSPHPQLLPVNAAVLGTIERIPAMERARELFWCGMRPEALAEWQLAYGSLPDEARPQAIHLAARWGWYEQAIATATAQHVFNDYVLLYPRPFDAEVTAAARLAQLAPEIVYGVIRQESLYRIDAVSSAGARGLMQLEPDTARRTARAWSRPVPKLTDLFDPSTNLSLGAARLRMLLDRFDGQIPVALAGYNAGPNAVSRWLPAEPIDADIWIENIPYNETRGYVQRILWHSLLYTWLGTDGAAQATTSWVTSVRPLRPAERDNRVALSGAPKHSPTAPPSRAR